MGLRSLKGSGEAHSHPLGVQPRAGHGLPNEVDEAPYSQLKNRFRQSCRIHGQDVEHVGKTHQVVVAPHRVPVVREAMLVVALTLLHKNAGLEWINDGRVTKLRRVS